MTREEAINKVRQMSLPKETMEILQALAPELKESKDERIREQIEQALIEHDWSVTYKVGKDDCLAWLEKQKEQKPDDVKREWWNKGYLEGRKNAHIPARELGLPSSWDFQKEPKPAEWSEKDEKMIEGLITRLNRITYNTRTDSTSPNITFFEEIAWLKSLRSRPTSSDNWKPNEEQMCELNWASKLSPILESLYNDLKKLI